VARFVVWGKEAEYITSEQPWNYAFGLGSPLDRFLKLNGKILLLGCDHDNVTFLHYVEHIADIPAKRVARYQVPVEAEGRRVWREMEEFDTSGQGVHPNWPENFFSQLVDGYLATRNNGGTLVGDARSYLFPARELLDFALPWMRSVAADQQAASKLSGFK
jgi:aminoglycoside 3-N-acetyltransferase